MLSWIWCIPAFPLLGFLILAIAGRRLGKTGTALVGVGSVGLSLIAAAIAVRAVSRQLRPTARHSR